MSYLGFYGDPNWDEIANVLTHMLGFLGAVVGFTLFTIKVRRRAKRRTLLACLVFSLTLCTMYAASTVYHAVPPPFKYHALIFDQAAVFLAVGGTVTAYALLAKAKAGIFSYLLIWLGVAAAILIQIFAEGTAHLVAFLSLCLGGACLQCLARGPCPGMGWLVGGGMVYLLGLPFLANGHIPFAHACWHLFVLLGSMCHYMALRAAAPRRETRPRHGIAGIPAEAESVLR